MKLCVPLLLSFYFRVVLDPVFLCFWHSIFVMVVFNISFFCVVLDPVFLTFYFRGILYSFASDILFSWDPVFLRFWYSIFVVVPNLLFLTFYFRGGPCSCVSDILFSWWSLILVPDILFSWWSLILCFWHSIFVVVLDPVFLCSWHSIFVMVLDPVFLIFYFCGGPWSCVPLLLIFVVILNLVFLLLLRE